jgi:NACalpha-BTF3-like transcription factor
MCTNPPTATAILSLEKLRYGEVLVTNVKLNATKIEDMNAQAQLSAAQQLGAGGGFGNAASKAPAAADDAPPAEPVEEEGEVDETGVDPKDIELVMAQVNCSRAKAVRVLKESGGDLINASKKSTYNRLRRC